MRTDSTRAVYDYRGAYWWNVAGVSIIALGGLVSLTLRVLDGDLVALAPGAVWFCVVAFVARRWCFSALYRIEADGQLVYWHRRGTELSAPLSDVASITGSGTIGTIRFRGDREPLKVYVGRGFDDFAQHVKAHAPGTTISLGWVSRLSGHLHVGGGFSGPGRQR